MRIKSSELPFGVFDKVKAAQPGIESAITPGADICQADHSRFYTEHQFLELKDGVESIYTIEFSRGCWKGYNRHCTFCGLNGLRMFYRCRDTEKVIHEIASEYKAGKKIFYLVDSVIDLNKMKYIFDYCRHYFKDAIFMCDTVSSLSFKQMKYLADCGFLIITAGIESLHPRHLKLMRKGVAAISNIAYLKYAKINKITVLWNMLTLMPGDTCQDYEELAEITPYLEHLSPPNFSIIRFDRHSLYWENPDKYGITLVPMSNVSYLYPEDSDIDLNAISMYFDNTRDDATVPYKSVCLVNLRNSIINWQRMYRGGASLKLEGNMIHDTRSISCCKGHVVDENEMKLIEFLFFQKTKEETAMYVNQNNLSHIFDLYIKRGYIIMWDNHYISLIIHDISPSRRKVIDKRWTYMSSLI